MLFETTSCRRSRRNLLLSERDADGAHSNCRRWRLHWARINTGGHWRWSSCHGGRSFLFWSRSFQGLTGNETLRILRGDVRDFAPSDFEGVDAVFDLAALANDPSGDLDPSLTTAVNYQGRLHVATCAKAAGVGRYILSSSCSVYGHGETTAEESSTAPLSTYAKSSLHAEQETSKRFSSNFCWSAIRNACQDVGRLIPNDYRGGPTPRSSTPQ